MNDLTITLIGKYGQGENTLFVVKTVDLADFTDSDELKSDIEDEFTNDEGESVPVEVDEIELEVDNWEQIPKEYQDLKTVWEYVETVEKHDQEIVDAAIYCGVDLDDIDEAYSGQYGDDEDFAQDMADQLGAVDKNATWPMNCIDWEFAAKELMYDYSEHRGYYFRNL